MMRVQLHLESPVPDLPIGFACRPTIWTAHELRGGGFKKNIWTISKFPETLFSPNSILALNYNTFCSSLRVDLEDPSDGNFDAGRNGPEFRCLCPTHFRNWNFKKI